MIIIIVHMRAHTPFNEFSLFSTFYPAKAAQLPSASVPRIAVAVVASISLCCFSVDNHHHNDSKTIRSCSLTTTWSRLNSNDGEDVHGEAS